VITAPGGFVAHTPDLELTEGATRAVRLVAQPGASIAGVVVDGATGAPAADVEVGARLPDGQRVMTRTNKDGEFVVEGVVPGPRVRLFGFASSTLKRFSTELAVPGLGARVQAGTLRLSEDWKP
jgi:hypothetical protein